MITKMFSVFDSKAGNFSPPFFMVNVGAALRAFVDIANDRDTAIARHPEDYSLFLIGEFDDLTGEVKMQQHENLGNAASYKKPSFDPGLVGSSIGPGRRFVTVEEVKPNGVKEEVVQ